jgi:tetratricopeptide (TPR) repeat protein
METGARWRHVALGLAICAGTLALESRADPKALEQARGLLAQGNPAGAYGVLAPLEPKLAGQPDYDYLLGVASLDSARLEDAIIAFERVLAVQPNHAGAQMDLARAYYAAGSFDLAEAAFVKLRAAKPPATALAAIERYLDAIRERRQQTRAGWTSFGELGLGYDTNITGVPVDFGAAAQQAFNLAGIEATGNSVKRRAAFVQGAAGTEYSRPLSRGWSAFAGGELRGRAYRREDDFNSFAGEVRAGAARNDGADQWRAAASLMGYRQEGAAPGDPKPTNDRNMGGLSLDWRHALNPRTQLGLGLQLNAVRFPKNEIEDFDQLYLSAAWLKSFERAGLPLFYVTAFATEDRARNKFADGFTDKSKNLAGVRTYFQYSLSPRVQVFNALGLVARRDKDAFARSTQVEKGRDTYGEAALGVAWQFREGCTLRAQYAYSGNRSNIDIYDFNRHEISSVIRCDSL